jgi:hypothetical protein
LVNLLYQQLSLAYLSFDVSPGAMTNVLVPFKSDSTIRVASYLIMAELDLITTSLSVLDVALIAVTVAEMELNVD